MNKKIIVGLIIVVLSIAFCGCAYPYPGQYTEPAPKYEQQFEQPFEQPHEEQFEQPHKQPQEQPHEKPADPAKPEEPKVGIGELIGVEGTVISVKNDIVSIKTPAGESIMLRQSEDMKWAPNVDDWNIQPHKYIAVLLVWETPGQGKIIEVTFNGFAG